MNQTVFLSELRKICLVVIAYALGKGWLSAADSSLIGGLLPGVGLLAGPWLWGLYSTINMKLVPHDSIAIEGGTPLAVDRVDAKGNLPIGATITQLASTAKVVGALLAGILLFSISDARAQVKAPAVDPAISLAVKLQVLTPEKLQAALDDATANGDPYSPNCYRALIPLAEAAQASNAAANAKPKGTPNANIKLVLIYQKLRDLRRAAQTIQNALNGTANTDIVIACAPMALDSATVINMVIGQVTGAAVLIPK